MSCQDLSQKLIAFLDASPTPFHAVKNMTSMLAAHGFFELREDRSWKLKPGDKYFFTRSDSTLVAFVYGKKPEAENGIRVVGAHTDSPCLKVKPEPEKNVKGYQQLGIEVYGGALLNPWFDRDLSLAGKVSYLNNDGDLKSALVDFKQPIAIIPSLAIHLDREANSKRSVNPQKDMNPILLQGKETFSLRELLAEQLGKQGVEEVAEVLDYNVSFYDCQGASLVGIEQQFLASARLDNLLSSYVGAHALAHCDAEQTSVLVCNDHEEVGSNTDIGAQGTVMSDLLQRLFPEHESRHVAVQRSMLLSVDNAHGVHPNYPDKHDDNHGPLLNGGPVLKFDANQNYATSSDSAAFVRKLCRGAPLLDLQTYVTKADMRCGSTIGPLTAANIGIKTLDIGVPTFAMHSVRELAGARDIDTLEALLSRFFNEQSVALQQ